MIDACQLPDDRADVDPARPSPGSSAIVTPASSPSLGGQKKACAPAAGCSVDCTTATTPYPGSRLRRPADLPRGRGPARGLSALWHCEAGAASLPGGQSLLRQSTLPSTWAGAVAPRPSGM